MNITGAVVHEKGGNFRIENAKLDPPKAGEVLVRMVASGICKTDVSVRDQYKPVPLPAILGHEGSGIVESIGEGVTCVEPGDHVVLTFTSCGECQNCKKGKMYACHDFFHLNFSGTLSDGTHRFHQDGCNVSHFFGQSSLSSHSIVSERNIVKVDPDVPIELLGPLGCGVQTGSGTVFHKLDPEPGSSIAVFGCGSVGLSSIMAAKIVGCSVIIAVDVHEDRLELAKELGATLLINSKESDPVEEIKRVCPEGVNFAIETSAIPDVLNQAFEAISLAGTTVLLGGPPLGTKVTLDMNELLYEKTITGVVQGDSIPQEFIPKMIQYYKEGKFPFDKMVKFYSLENINQAVSDMESGKTIKPIVSISKLT